MKRICIVVSSPRTVRAFMRGQLSKLSQQYEVWVVANTNEVDDLAFLPAAVRVVPIRIERKISPLRDLLGLARLLQLFRRKHFDLVHSVTPKAGLLAMTAAFAARVPVRIHTFTGQVWATKQGWRRWILRAIDRITASLATHVLVDSHSQRAFLLQERVVRSRRSSVLVNGSISGVDIERFAPDPIRRKAIRDQLGLDDTDILFLFLGRLSREKGVPELIEAFRRISAHWPRAHLALVGHDIEGLVALPSARRIERIHAVEYTLIPESFFNAADVLCISSHREGFGTVVIEAASVGIPTIASRIYGLTDAVVDAKTGTLHEVGSVDDLARCMEKMLQDPLWRRQLGHAARDRARTDFASDLLTDALLTAYAGLLRERAHLSGGVR